MSTLFLSSFPEYWAPRTWNAATMPKMMRFWINCSYVARETAAMELWFSEPSIIVSEAPTKDSIKLWKAIGRAKESRFFINTLSLNVSFSILFFILLILAL